MAPETRGRRSIESQPRAGIQCLPAWKERVMIRSFHRVLAATNTGTVLDDGRAQGGTSARS